MSRDEKREVFARVMRASRPNRQRRIAIAFALAGAAAAAVILPFALRRDDAFTARGSAGPVAAFEPRCRSGACAVGDALMFDLDGSSGYRYFAAFARTDDGTVIWYIPDSFDLDPVSHLAPRAVVLDRAGHVEIYGVFSDAPLTRDAIKARFRPGATDVGPGTAVTTRELTVR